jgi:hypothetical protein
MFEVIYGSATVPGDEQGFCYQALIALIGMMSKPDFGLLKKADKMESALKMHCYIKIGVN